MPFWRLFYHVVWTTKRREPLIDGQAEGVVVRSIRTTARDMGALIHAIGIVPDHVHVALSIPPSVAVSTFVGRMKGASAHAVNDVGGRGRHSDAPSFAWQTEYGVLSYGERNLPDVIAYVGNQKHRHSFDQVWPTMEQVADGP